MIHRVSATAADTVRKVLIVHRSERADRLVEPLGAVLSQTPQADPFVSEVVSVPARGVERWLGQSLSVHLGVSREDCSGSADGITANIEFPSPTELLARVAADLRGHRLCDDPWSPGRVLWALANLLDELSANPACSTLARHLHSANDRYTSTALRLASMFAGYSEQRPQMLRAWVLGDDTDGFGAPLSEHHQWQPVVWRTLRSVIGTPSPAEELDVLCQRLREDPSSVELPGRVFFFGPTRLSASSLQMIDALRIGREVYLYVPQPQLGVWPPVDLHDSVVYPPARPAGDVRRPRHRLAALLARDCRELAQRLAPLSDDVVDHGVDFGGCTTLRRLQAGIAADENTPVTVNSHAEQGDSSIEVHLCHGPQRQVEVLRERLLHAFADDETLQPRDVIVMCPDVEVFAPLVRAAFGHAAEGEDRQHPGHALRVRLADRSVTHENEILAVAAALMDLAHSRVSASQLLGLISLPAVRRRFGFADDEMDTVISWIETTNIRWGIDDTQREAFGLGGFPQNTAATALDRVMLGVVADESAYQWLGRVLPLEGIEGSDIDLAGRFAELVSRLGALLNRCAGRRSATDWATITIDALSALATSPPDGPWQHASAVEVITDVVAHSGQLELTHNDFRSVLNHAFVARPTRSNFRTGELTVCTLTPMRSVPHRIIVLLGFDDDVYPRVTRLDGDDICGVTPHVGERDPRSEDRQVLIDAAMSARDALWVFYTGTDPVTGLRRPPAVPVGELIDAAVAVAGTRSIIFTHPLHSFDPQEFAASSPFSFDRAAFRGAQALVAHATTNPEPSHGAATAMRSSGFVVPRPLSPIDNESVDLDDLVAFVEHPVRAFFRQRLAVSVPQADDGFADELSAELRGLDDWQVGNRILEATMAGVDPAAIRGAELRRGTLPPFRFGEAELQRVDARVAALTASARSVVAAPASSYDIDIDLGDRPRLTGNLTGVHGTTVTSIVYSRIKAKHQLAVWVRLLAAASVLDQPTSLLVGWTGRSARSIHMASPPDARTILARLIDLYARGMRSPIPVATEASCAYADARLERRNHDEALGEARAVFGNGFGESGDRYLYLAFPGGLGEMAAYTRTSHGWSEEDWSFILRTTGVAPTLFSDIAGALWSPLRNAQDSAR